MCGILGEISKNVISLKKFEESITLLEHRGPDNISIMEMKNSEYTCLFGHTRLKIIDLTDSSNQPFEIADKVIVFNGEIYNYKPLKSDLEEKGVIFHTSSDTETILQMYHYYGIEKTLSKLHGMFSFSIYDKSLDKLFIVRDRIGIKPLYYFMDDEQFLFSSEVKAINFLVPEQLTINKDSIANYYYHRHIAEPQTIYNEINAVNPGEYITLNLKDFSMKSNKYWKLENLILQKSENQIIQELDELLHTSVQEHLISDVPISFALSGGLDSSLLIAMSKEYKKDIVGYTIKRSEDDIDWYYSKKIAGYLDVDHRVVDFKSLDMQNEDKKLFDIYDNPLACSSIFSTYLLYKEVSKEFKVCISGDGADEILGGYKWYQHYFDMTMPSLDTFKNVDRLKYFIRHYFKYFQYNDILKYKKIMLDRYSKDEVENTILFQNTDVKEEDMYYQHIQKIDNIKDLMYVDFFTFLRYGLIRADLSSMAHSVENRVPFLDHRIVEFAFSIDPELFNKKGTLKYLLKKVAEKYLPKEYIYRPKKGFSAPTTDILPVKNAKEHMKYIYDKWENKFVK